VLNTWQIDPEDLSRFHVARTPPREAALVLPVAHAECH
jgi:hypothetical protein